MAKPKEEKEVRKLECKVSKTEIEDRKNRLVSCDSEINGIIVLKREEAAGHNKAMRELREEQENLISAVSRGVELRDVDCFWKQNDRLHKKELIRADTGKVVVEKGEPVEEPQTLADKQEDLFDGEHPPTSRSPGTEKPKRGRKPRASAEA